MTAIQRFEDIEGWQLSRQQSQELTRITRASKQFKDLNLLTQMEKCADSAMSNIVEGFDSGSDPEFHRFLRISYRSLSEFQSHLFLALDRNCLSQASFDLLYGMARRAKGKVGGFMRYLKKPRA
jgi:four helix bundle protein